jgi:hypothetical protein
MLWMEHTLMGKSRVRRRRKIRRQMRAVLKHGPSAKPSHRLKSGRTGKVHSKKLQSRRQNS